MKKLILAFALVASAAPVLADGFPNSYSSYR